MRTFGEKKRNERMRGASSSSSSSSTLSWDDDDEEDEDEEGDEEIKPHEGESSKKKKIALAKREILNLLEKQVMVSIWAKETAIIGKEAFAAKRKTMLCDPVSASPMLDENLRALDESLSGKLLFLWWSRHKLRGYRNLIEDTSLMTKEIRFVLKRVLCACSPSSGEKRANKVPEEAKTRKKKASSSDKLKRTREAVERLFGTMERFFEPSLAERGRDP